MTSQHRMTKAHPLACNCKPGWVSYFRREPTHPLACNCKTGWVFFTLFFKSTNDDDEPCRLVVDKPSLITWVGGQRAYSHCLFGVGANEMLYQLLTSWFMYFSPPPCMQLQAGVGFFLLMRTHSPP